MTQLFNYTGGIIEQDYKSTDINHAVSVVGWGTYIKNEKNSSYWIMKILGKYWGTMGFVNIEFGSLLIESQCFGHCKDFTIDNYPCYEGGENCLESIEPFLHQIQIMIQMKKFMYLFFLITISFFSNRNINCYNRRHVYV